MTITAGVLSVVSVGSSTASLSATAATAGTGPYAYQWYRSTTTGFSPGVGNLIAGATALTLNDSGLTPGTLYYWKVVATDTGHSNDTAEYTQVSATTGAPEQSQNQFAQAMYLGVLDQLYSYNTKAAMIDVSQTGLTYPGAAVKLVDSAGGPPKVIKCTAVTDVVFGFVNYNIKNPGFVAGQPAEISQAGNVMYLYATAAIARGAKLMLDLSTNGGVITASGSGATIVGWAYDKATAVGQLIRVQLAVPYELGVVP